jgi:hypothetical protein
VSCLTEEGRGCTTVKTYILYTENGIIRKEDGGCDWRGFANLKQVIFGKMEE